MNLKQINYLNAKTNHRPPPESVARHSQFNGISPSFTTQWNRPWGVCDCLLLQVCLCPLFEFTAATTLCVVWKASHGFHTHWENWRFQCFTTALVQNTRRHQWRIQDDFTMENIWRRVWNKMRRTWRKNSANLNIRRFSIFKGKKWWTRWLRFTLLKRGT